MAASDDMSRLATRAKEAEDRVAAAKTKARDRIQEDVDNARKRTQEAAEKLQADSATATARTEAWGADLQRSWNDHLQQARQRMDARKARLDAKMAGDAQDAEDYADFTIDVAYSALEEAEYAVLDAILARADADAAAHAATT